MFKTKDEYEKLQNEAKARPKIKILYDGSCAHFSNGATQFFLSQAGFLADFYNVHFLAPGDGPDLIWVASDKFRDEYLEAGVPIIVEDVFQGPDIFDSCREILKHDQVKFFLKAMMTHNYEIHNKFLCNHSIHQDVINTPTIIDSVRGIREPNITEKDYKKVRLSWNYITWPHFRHGFNNDHRALRDYYLDTPIPKFPELYTLPESGSFLIGNREYDVNFIGNIQNWPDTVPLIKHHRQIAWDALKKCPGNNLLRDSNCLGWHKYWHKMRQSKIVVSPWGWEPITIRDVEAILAGCILIKPDATFVQTYPNLPCIRCNQDFSNLQDVVEMVLSKWETMDDFRRTAYDQLEHACNTMVKRLYGIIRDALPHLSDSSG